MKRSCSNCQKQPKCSPGQGPVTNDGQQCVWADQADQCREYQPMQGPDDGRPLYDDPGPVGPSGVPPAPVGCKEPGGGPRTHCSPSCPSKDTCGGYYPVPPVSFEPIPIHWLATLKGWRLG